MDADTETETKRGPDSKPGDWTCPSGECGVNNFAYRQHCFKCEARRPDAPEDAKPGDWRCAKCGVNNFASRVACFKCHNPKGGRAMDNPQGAGGNFKAGDWMCNSCQGHNFAYRNDCFKCNSPKGGGGMMGGMGMPMMMGGGMQAMMGGMQAPAGYRIMMVPVNSGFGAVKSGWQTSNMGPYSGGMQQRGGGGGGYQYKSGDWKCPGCGFDNFASRSECKDCNEKKPEGLEDKAFGGGGRPGDWRCPGCSFDNFASRTQCKDCGKDKP